MVRDNRMSNRMRDPTMRNQTLQIIFVDDKWIIEDNYEAIHVTEIQEMAEKYIHEILEKHSLNRKMKNKEYLKENR
jgi:hypothetical protein